MRAPAREVVQGQLVYGLHIQNPRLARLTRRVLCLVTVTAALVIANSLWTYFNEKSNTGRASSASLVISIALALIVPCCGYWGAKNNDRTLTCCFCGCNALGGCLGIFILAMSFLGLGALHHIVEQCSPGVAKEGCPSDAVLEQMCPDLPTGYTATDCWDHIKDTVPKLEHSAHVSIYTSVPIIILQCLGFCWGKKLHDELGSGQVLHQAPQFTTQPTMVQPLRPYDAKAS